MKTLRCLALAAVVAAAAGAAGCSDDDAPAVKTADAAGSDAASGTPDGGAAPDGGGVDTATPGTEAGTPDAMGPAPITLVQWVDDLTTNHTNATDLPDSVDDKNIIDTTDEAAFDPLLK